MSPGIVICERESTQSDRREEVLTSKPLTALSVDSVADQSDIITARGQNSEKYRAYRDSHPRKPNSPFRIWFIILSFWHAYVSLIWSEAVLSELIEN